jgi:3-oxoacyl-[acyl-carrier-protein] synthase II
MFSESVLNAPAGNLSIAFNVKGPAHTIVGGSPSGLEALHMGKRLVATGSVDVCLVVSTEELNERVYEVYERLGYVSAKGAPFSSKGFLPGEGAACLVLEGKDAAIKRGASSLALLSATSSLYSPDGAGGVMKSMDRVLSTAGVEAGDVDCIMSGASGTGASLDEGTALGMLLADGTAVRGIKGLVGESFGAGSLMGVALAVSLVKEGTQLWSDPTKNTAPEWGWADFSTESKAPETVLVTATGLLGESAAAVIRKVL